MLEPQERETLTQGGSVTPQRFAQVRAIFEAALERPATERRAYAAGACAGDSALLHEVEGMLAAEGKADALLDGKPPSSAPGEGRFPPGTVLAGRYRILGLLGKGGMGEVYKAFDLILNQTVALKFLSPVHISEAALVRFRNEVRIARQVSHPNVCRVYDLGMVEALHFLSMEYIDGEDLASLLRRIGRLPQDKAIEFTRKICAGLSAAHERGVLHRDLKPANIMIDGRGQVRITDFGLAGLAAEIPLSDLRSGTPAYMSPEQKAGKEVTTRSDIYSLGLVLHEMFTGKARKDTQSSPSELVKDLDPAIDRLILRCLEEDPKRRPQTALNVAMALPGADPIAAALAAGETPSPEMVAASEEKEGFSPRTAAICFGLVIVAVIAAIAIQSKYGFMARAPLPIPPDGLAYRAEQLLKSLGYTEQFGTIDYGFSCCDMDAEANVRSYEPTRRDEILASHQPPVILFYYRSAPTLSAVGSVFHSANPFPDGTDFTRDLLSGVHLILNANGKLIRLEARLRDAPVPQVVDWDALFLAAGLDRALFSPTTPEGGPYTFSDLRLAWTGRYTDNRIERVRVEAASWHGRPVVFDVRVFPPAPRGSEAPGFLALVALVLPLVIAGAVTAWRNLRLGRSDRHGAVVIAGASFLLGVAGWALGPSHTDSPPAAHTLVAILAAVSQTLFSASIMWAFYLAIEPYARRHWPDSLISWTRLANGKVRNALVASHVLAAVVAAGFFFVATILVQPLTGYLVADVSSSSSWMGSAGEAMGFWFNSVAGGVAFGLALLLMVVLLRLLLRKMWLADFVAALLLSLLAGDTVSSANWRVWAWRAFLTVSAVVWIWLLRRFGFLTIMVTFCLTASRWPVVISGWFAGRSLTFHFIPIAIAAWALWVIVSEKRAPSLESAA